MKSGINWLQVRVLYRRELRGALRERSIVVNGIILPIFLYPLMLWVMFSAIVFVEGISQGFVSRVVVIGLPPQHAALRDSLAATEQLELTDAPRTAAAALAAVEAGELDVLVEFLPARQGADALPGNFRVRLTYDRSEERGRRAQARIEGTLGRYRDAWIASEADALGIQREELEQFRIARRTVSSERQMGAFLLSQLVPVFLVIMVALGCFIPSIDTTAGERERSTWETLMSVSASRLSIVTAKYLYVATLGIAAGALNVVAIMLSIGAVLRPLLRDSGEAFQFSMPALALPVMILGAVALALLFAAAMMILASFARTFKEGQAMITPVYWLALIPAVLAGQPELHLTPTLALIPVANVAVMIRDAINGEFQWLLIGETLLVVLILVGLCLWLASTVLRFEDFLLGSFDGSFWRFAKDRLFARRARGATSGVSE